MAEAKRNKRGGQLPDGWLITKFHVAFPGLLYRWGQGWPNTKDGVIPFKLFVLLLTDLNNIESESELQHARSVALGIGLAFGGNESKVRSAVRHLQRNAYPRE